MPGKVKVISVDPYHKVYGLLVPMLAQRLLESVQAMGDDANLTTTSFMSMLWAANPNALLLAAVDGSGKIKGFCAATIAGQQFDGSQGQVFMLQPRMDEPTENDAVSEMVEIVSNWAKSRNINSITLVARRSDPKWLKRHGFEVQRYIMVKELE